MRAQLAPYCVLRSSDPDEMMKSVTRLFKAEHRQRLIGRSSVVRARIDNARFGNMALRFVEYGAPVILDEGMLDCVLVQMPIKGCIETHCGDQFAESTPRCYAVLSPRQQIAMRWRPDTSHIVLHLDRRRVERLVESATGQPVHDPIRFALGMPAHGPAGGAMRRLVHYVLSELVQPESALSQPLVMSQIENTIVATLLSVQPHNYSELMARAGAPAAPYYVRRAEDFMRAHAHEPIGIAEIVAATGANARTLSWGFRRYLGVAPLSYLRALRLDSARLDLLRATPESDSVTEVAFRWGFGHLGRFARDYAVRFGELPSKTLRR